MLKINRNPKMKVYLVRHGEAVSSGVDPKRPLSEQGLTDVRKVASFIKPLKISVEHIWHSGKLRAAQTAEIMTSVVVVKDYSAHESLGPNDDVKIITEEIEAYDTNIMIVGHLPFLGCLASLLLAGKDTADVVEFDAGSIACFNRTDPGQWQIEWMITPALLA
jgi:phosphohistidine phosphatase